MTRLLAGTLVLLLGSSAIAQIGDSSRLPATTPADRQPAGLTGQAPAKSVAAKLPNVALRKRARQSSTARGGVASRAVDGTRNGDFAKNSVTQTNRQRNPWWEVDLGARYSIQRIQIYNRTDCCAERFNNYSVLVVNGRRTRSQPFVPGPRRYDPGDGNPVTLNGQSVGRYVRIQLQGAGVLSLAEVRIFGTKYQPPAAPPKPQPLVSSISVPWPVLGGQSVPGTVFLTDVAPAGGVNVQFDTSPEGALALPASVTIPAGQNRADVTVAAADVTSNVQVFLSASAGDSSSSRQFTVYPDRSHHEAIRIRFAAEVTGGDMMCRGGQWCFGFTDRGARLEVDLTMAIDHPPKFASTPGAFAAPFIASAAVYTKGQDTAWTMHDLTDVVEIAMRNDLDGAVDQLRIRLRPHFRIDFGDGVDSTPFAPTGPPLSADHIDIVMHYPTDAWGPDPTPEDLLSIGPPPIRTVVVQGETYTYPHADIDLLCDEFCSSLGTFSGTADISVTGIDFTRLPAGTGTP